MNVLILSNQNNFKKYIADIFSVHEPAWILSYSEIGAHYSELINACYYPDTVIVDMESSDINIFELVENIQSSFNTNIVVLNSSNDISLLVQAFNAGVDDYITIPFNPVVFIAKIKAIIRRKKWEIQSVKILNA
ncbi:MAG: response regulator transcription factor [Eubacteriales bacterium]